MEGPRTVVLSENADAFIALKEMLSWAVVLYDRIDKKGIPKKDILFMSGIKYIDNVLKHEKKIYDIFSILCPGIEIRVDANDGPEGPVLNSVEMDPQLVWGDLKEIPIYEEYKQQRSNYSKYVSRKSVFASTERIDDILAKCYRAKW